MHHPITGFEHLHRHSDWSLQDGLGMVEEYAKRSKEINQKYLCITDHGVMGAVPAQIAQAEKNNLYPLFGVELYVNKMQPKAEDKEESKEFRRNLPENLQKKFDKSSHLLAIAHNDVGYKNLVQIASWAWRYGMYRKPRVNHDVLMQYKEGIVFTSTCANSEIANAYFEGGDDMGFDVIEKYMAMFGDKFYLELMMLDFKLQKPYNTFLIKCHNRYNIPVILSQDCHYCYKENSKHQRLMLMLQNGKTIQEVDALIKSGAEDVFELQDTNLWMKSEDELNEKWELDYHDNIDYDLYKIAKANTVSVCELAKGVQLDRSIKLPSMFEEEKTLRRNAMRGFIDRNIPQKKNYIERFEEEYALICEKGFCSYFLIQQMMVQEAMDRCPEIYGWSDASNARGPGRGSVCGSLLAYCLDLHDVDPIKHDLLFSRFLSPARGGKQMKTRFSSDPIFQNVA